MIIAVIGKIINEIYHTIGAAGERTKQDNSVGIDNSSGVAKAYDFERLNSLLKSKAEGLEYAENKLLEMVAGYTGKTINSDEPLVKYPEDFDIRSLYDEFDVAERLMLIEAPDEIRQEQMKAIVEKLFPRVKKDLKARLLKAAEDWELEQIREQNEMPQLSASENRQGQVTDETDTAKQAA